MSENKSQGAGRIIGMDIHPAVFSACALENTGAFSAKELYMHDRVDMDDLERWFRKNNRPGDLYVMEAGSNSFATAERIRKLGGHAVVLESFRAGQIHKAYLKNDKVDARKIARIYLSGMAITVWQPDKVTLEKRDILSGYERSKRDLTRCRNRLWSWLCKNGVKRPKNLKLTRDEGLRWILECRDWSINQKTRIKMMHADLVHAEKQRKEYMKIMAAEIAQDPDMLKLQQLCGLRLVVIYALSAVIGDIARFKTPKKLVAYIGLQPGVKQSGENGRNLGIRHTGRKDLRSLLVQAAHAILRSASSDNSLATWGRRMVYRKGRNIAVIAVARKLTTYVWYLMRGFFTPLQAISKSFRDKLQKLAVVIGTETRRAMGYKSIRDFIKEKEEILLASG